MTATTQTSDSALPSDPELESEAVASEDLLVAVRAMRELILAGEHYRLAVAVHLGVSVNETQAISHLFIHGAMGQSELAAAMNITTSTVTGMLDRLEARGLMMRVPDPTDRRRSSVVLSPRGEQELHEVRTWMQHAFEQIDPARFTEVADLLSTLAGSLRDFTSVVVAKDSPHEPPRRRL